MQNPVACAPPLGTVISRVGSAMVAMCAHAHHVPVMVCAESHKFHERVQMDSITNNELGDPDELVAVEQHPDIKHLNGWQSVEKLGTKRARLTWCQKTIQCDDPHIMPIPTDVLNLLYDAMPCEYVSMVCTEFGPLPPTSVPVILRESREEWLPL